MSNSEPPPLPKKRSGSNLAIALFCGAVLACGVVAAAWHYVGKPYVRQVLIRLQASARRADSTYPRGAQIGAVPSSLSDRETCRIDKSWSKRVIIDEYMKSPGADPKVAQFLEHGIAYLINTNDRETAKFSEEALALQRTGVNDPIYQLFAGLVISDQATQIALLQQSVKGFEKTSYPRFIAFMAAANLGKTLYEARTNPAQIQGTDTKALQWLREGLNQATFHEDELVALRWRMNAGSVNSLIERKGDELLKIVESCSSVPPWMTQYLAGRTYLRLAWRARGGGWNNTVTREGWKGWEQNLAFARARLTRSWELNPKDPSAATDMIEVAMGDGSGKQEMRQWFDRAVAAQIDFPQAYQNMAWGLRPRWLGSHEEMLAFADECAATERYDTAIPYHYVNIVREIASEEEDHDAIYRTDNGRKARAVLDGYVHAKESPYSPSYIHTLAAILAYKVGDRTAAARELAAINFHPDPAPDLTEMLNISRMVKELSTNSRTSGPFATER